MNPASVTVIVVTWRSAKTIAACLEALAPLHAEGWLRASVVDNASDDGTPDLVRRQFPWVQVIDSGANLGFARGNNLALRTVETPYVLCLNPDARLEREGLVRLLGFLEHRQQAAIVGPAIDNGGGEPQPLLPYLTPLRLVRTALGRLGNPEAARVVEPGLAPQRVDWVCGAVLLARASVLRELGGFDGRFFLYFEEMDLCKRATELGHEVWTFGEASASHAFATSSRQTNKKMFDGCIAEHYFRSRFYYLRKHHGWLTATFAELVDRARRRLLPLGRR